MGRCWKQGLGIQDFFTRNLGIQELRLFNKICGYVLILKKARNPGKLVKIPVGIFESAVVLGICFSLGFLQFLKDSS